jgi:hypothetical protein
MAGEQAFCPKCGSPVTPGSAFCSKCGAALSVRAQAPQPAPMGRRYEKGEKEEKHEKREKREKGRDEILGPLIGGSILIWLGLTFYYQTIGYLSSSIWWAYFVGGIGVILIGAGLATAIRGNRAYYGYLIGGAVLFLVGFAEIQGGWQNLWPLFIVVIGVAVIVGGVLGRRRSPTP